MKGLLQSKKFLVILVICATLAGGLLMFENKAGSEIAKRIEEQLTLIGCQFKSVEVSPVGQSVEIKGLEFNALVEENTLNFYAEKIILADVSFEALDPEAGDYPLVAQKIQFENSSLNFTEGLSSIDLSFDEYTINNWSQNIALLIEATEYGYASVDFLERAFTYKFDKHEIKNLKVDVIVDDLLDDNSISLFIENATSIWNNDNTLSSSMTNFEFAFASEFSSFFAQLAHTEAQAPAYFISPKALALITNLAITNPDDTVAEELLYELLLDEELHEEINKITIVAKDFSLDIDKNTVLTNGFLALTSNLIENNFNLQIEDLNLKPYFYYAFQEDFYSYLQAMDIEETSMNFALNAQILDDNKSISLAQNLDIDHLFKLDLDTIVEMMYPISNDLENPPNKFNSFNLSYEDKGLIPRSNRAIQHIFDVNIDTASNLQSSTVLTIASFVPDLQLAIENLFYTLGKIELSLNESVGIFDLLFIPPANLNKLFTIEYTPSNNTIIEAINLL